MNEKELKEYYDIFTNCGWRLFKKYSNPTDDMEFWEALVKEAEELTEQSKKPKAARKIAVAVMQLLKDIDAEHREDNK